MLLASCRLPRPPYRIRSGACANFSALFASNSWIVSTAAGWIPCYGAKGKQRWTTPIYDARDMETRWQNWEKRVSQRVLTRSAITTLATRSAFYKEAPPAEIFTSSLGLSWLRSMNIRPRRRAGRRLFGPT